MKPMLYVKGMSQRDIEEALVQALGVEATGRSVINEVCRSLRGHFERWQERDLSGFHVLYLFLDGIYMKLRPEEKRKVAVLCAYGMLWDGRKVLLHMAVGDKESTARTYKDGLVQARAIASGLSLMLAVLLDASEGWRGVRIKPYIEERLKQMAVDPDSAWEDPDLAKLAA